jgi:hypothetical protein
MSIHSGQILTILHIEETELFSVLQQTIFGLCPRGNGVSSIRFVETILNGGIPVLMNDELLPFGQDVQDFAVRWDFATENIEDNLDEMYRYLHILASNTTEMKRRYKNMYAFAVKYLVSDLLRVTDGEARELQALPCSDSLIRIFDEYYISLSLKKKTSKGNWTKFKEKKEKVPKQKSGDGE